MARMKGMIMEQETIIDIEKNPDETLDEILKAEGIMADSKEQHYEMPACPARIDYVAVTMSIEASSMQLAKKIINFDVRIKKIADGNSTGIFGRAFSGLFGVEKETSLMDEFNEVSILAKSLYSELGILLTAYSEGCSSIESLYQKKSTELMKQIESKEMFETQLGNKLKAKKALEEKLNSIKTENKNEIKYADAMANLTLKMENYKSGLNIEKSNIERCVAEKKRLFEERLYHGRVLDAYVEAFSVCKDMIEFFDVVMPMRIGTTTIIGNLKGLASTMEKIVGLSEILHEKAQEGLNYLANFNKKGIYLLGAGKIEGTNKEFTTDSYIKGLLG